MGMVIINGYKMVDIIGSKCDEEDKDDCDKEYFD